MRIFRPAAMVFLLATAPHCGFAADAHSHSHPHPHSHAHPHPDHQHDHPAATAPAGLPIGLLAAYSAAIASASLVGGWLPGRLRMSHLQFQMLISFVGGLMLGVATLHLMVHAFHEAGPQAVDALAWSLLGGILVMFLLLRAFHVHHHEPAAVGIDGEPHQHDAACSHGHAHTGAAGIPASSRLGWVGLFVGLGLHTLLDGAALGIAMQAEQAHGSRLPGLGTLLAVALHKPVDAMSIATLMMAGGWQRRSRLIVNVCFACLAPLAAAVVLQGMHQLPGGTGWWLGCGLACSAGIFLCISLADLLPEMQFHAHNRWRLTIALLLGAGLAWSIQFLEPAHLHSH